MTTQPSKTHLFGLNRQALTEWFVALGEKPFRAKQVMKWLYHERMLDFDQMTDLSKPLRALLHERAHCALPEIIADQIASDGTRKWVFRYPCGNSIETVFIPEDDRGTLCISSQAGCALACPFCSTAHEGFNRNLTSGEILAQVWLAKSLLGCGDNGKRVVTNVVLMGMGEPLVNFNNVIPATDIMMDDWGFGLSKRRVTLSTSGVVPAIKQLKEVTDLSLAVSLHAPNDALRDEIVPINKRYGLPALLEACQEYVAHNGQHGGVTWEYVMLRGVNDRLEHAKELAVLLKGIPGKINLIPFNPFPGSRFECSKRSDMLAFQRYLTKAGFIATIRKTRGEDIDAACGQLVGQVNDRSRRALKLSREQAEIA
ncbi:23S rRNA (adenine(2503)-C(2))-methyltransferase RlmN [Suttonella sp. R2A3]|uniref:23S rRNA (adenine(2503)-C(2))-methyltransferase RlmN n=1 Tax=Suttonella sp. R2A3 TaxID=2908648 RepID=UPI001F3DD120|nr:23S rRNA (adenine(2503)-C(2))-methyltransferase RlmN [Suttonella sp. R2A3]UJF23804.1 23S rRNA (adenine(2503)-C(2))-methyltransferase RlmN [Suttonella sp. R2A3]